MKEIKCPNCGSVFTVDESDYAEIAAQVRGEEFNREIKEREKMLSAEKDAAVRMAVSEKEGQFKDALIKKQSELQQKDNEILRLQSKVDSFENEKELAIRKAVESKESEIADNKMAIAKLEGELKTQETESKLKEQSQKNEYETLLKAKDDEIAFYKDFKAKLSTKMVGESLEQHCEITFNQIRPTAFPKAYFEKDNDARNGSKGDYIFRDYTDDGTEYISIMFDMKNEIDGGSAKHKNEDFYKKLDKDRTEKQCEYAVLVSMLEPENELFNAGIVDVSYKYPKMYVVRPQFFIPIISLLRDGARNSAEYKRQLAEIQSQNVDLANFEKEMADFKDSFGKNFKLASDHYGKAIEGIEKTIKSLEKTRDELIASMKQLNWANNKAEDLTIKTLTKNSPLLREKYEQLHAED